VIRDQADQVAALKTAAGDTWQEHGLAFPTRLGAEAGAANVRRAFRKVTAAAGLDPAGWTPRELRHSFVSLMSDAGVPIERISRLVGHSGTTVTETVYRKQIRPAITDGAEAMDRIFPVREAPAGEPGGPAADTPDGA
jgi:integrase